MTQIDAVRTLISSLVCCLLALGCGGSATSASSPDRSAARDGGRPTSTVGYTRVKLHDDERQRPVWVDLWYPADASAAMTELHYGLAKGRAARDAPPAEGNRNLIVLSHGAGGDGANYAWLTEHLAAQGYLVAAVNHYGESRTYGQGALDRLAMFRMWTRPADVKFAISSLLTDKKWRPLIRPDRMGGLGHSAGGHTLLVLAGADYDAARMGPYCASDAASADRGCEYARDLTGPERLVIGTRPDGSLPTEPRIAALFLMEPALGPSFTDAVLTRVTLPVQIVASKPGDFLPFEPHAGRVARLLPSASLTTLDRGEGHFVYLVECDLPIEVMGLPLCSDAPGVSRPQVHQALAELATEFFAKTLAPLE
jgi:predicted dienelactone hydrolase